MTVNGLHHTCYTVSSLDRSLAFYRDALGCKVLATQEKERGYLAAIVGYPDAHVRMAHLSVPGSNHVIELFEYLAPQGDHADVEPRNVGASHLCFLVDDLPGFWASILPASHAAVATAPPGLFAYSTWLRPAAADAPSRGSPSFTKFTDPCSGIARPVFANGEPVS